MPHANSIEATESRDSAWSRYWNEDTFWSQSRIWEINALLFSKRTAAILNFSKNDCVLDIGCGSGHTAELIAPLTGSFLGVDTSAPLLALARERCSRLPQVSFSKILDDQGRDFNRFGKFSLILCVSVIQYFPDLKSVVHLVRSISECALPGARMLIADIPQPRNLYQTTVDLAASIIQSLREEYFRDYLRILFQLPFSHYRIFSKKNSVLDIPVEILNSSISELGFKTTVLQESVSICARRPSLLIQF